MISPSNHHAERAEAKQYRGPRPTIPREKELELFEQLREKRCDGSTCWKDYQGFVREYVASISDLPSESMFPSDRKAQQIKAKFVTFLDAVNKGDSHSEAFRIACDSYRKATKPRKAGEWPQTTKRRKIQQQELAVEYVGDRLPVVADEREQSGEYVGDLLDLEADQCEPPIEYVGDGLPVEAESLMREAASLAKMQLNQVHWIKILETASGIDKRLLPRIANEIGLSTIWRVIQDNPIGIKGEYYRQYKPPQEHSWGAWSLLDRLWNNVDMSSTLEGFITELLQTIRRDPTGNQAFCALLALKYINKIDRCRPMVEDCDDLLRTVAKVICFTHGEVGKSHDADQIDTIYWNFRDAVGFLGYSSTRDGKLDDFADELFPIIPNLILEIPFKVSYTARNLYSKFSSDPPIVDRFFQEVVQPILTQKVMGSDQRNLRYCVNEFAHCYRFFTRIEQYGVIRDILFSLEFTTSPTTISGRRVSNAMVILNALSNRRRIRFSIANNGGISTILQVLLIDFGSDLKSIRKNATECLTKLASNKIIAAHIVDDIKWYSALVMLCRPVTPDDSAMWISKQVIILIWRLFLAEQYTCNRIAAKFVSPVMKGVFWGRPYNASVDMLEQRVIAIKDLCSRVIEQADASINELQNEESALRMHVASQMPPSNSLDHSYKAKMEPEHKLSNFIVLLSVIAKLGQYSRYKLLYGGLMYSTFFSSEVKAEQAHHYLKYIRQTCDGYKDDMNVGYYTEYSDCFDDYEDYYDKHLKPSLTLTIPSLPPNLNAANGISGNLQPLIHESVDRNNSACSLTGIESTGDDAVVVESSTINERAEEIGDKLDVLDESSAVSNTAGSSTGHLDNQHKNGKAGATNILHLPPSTLGVKYWLSRFSGELVDVERDGNCLLYASSIATHDNSNTNALDEATLQNLKMEVYTVMMGNLLCDVKFKLLDPVSELHRIKPGRQERDSLDEDMFDLLSYYKMEAKVSVKTYRPPQHWGGGHFLRALAQVKRTPIYVIDELASGEAHVQRYMCKTYKLQDGTNHESAWQESLSDREAERVFRAYTKAEVIPVMLVLRHSEHHFYAVSHGDLREWCPEGMRERQREAHRKLNSGWEDPSDLSMEERKNMAQQVEEELNRRRWM